MKVIAQDSESKDFDSEDASQLLEALADPFLAMRIIPAGFTVFAAQECFADTAID
ncbi:MAG: hypothetical protein WCK86_17325 [Planctomycetia bacterium]